METQLSIMSSSFSQIQSNVLSGANIVVPVALTLFSILILWSFIANLFRRIGK
jgi:hypothetical protein